MEFFRGLNIKTRVLFPLSGVFVLLAALAAFEIYHVMYRQREHDLNAQSKIIETALTHTLNNHLMSLTSNLELLKRDNKLLSLWVSKDRDGLLRYSSDIFNGLNKTNNVSHLYFIQKDRRVFLRVHKPEVYGDIINRITLLKAESSGQISSGVELGPLGTLTLRVVLPVILNHSLIGYMEIGIEMDLIFSDVQELTGNNIYVLLNKKYLKRESWESGMKMLNHQHDWNFLPDAVLIQKPDSLANALKEFQNGGLISPDDNFQFKYNGRIYMQRRIPLEDASDRNIGQIAVFFDVTEITRSAKGLLTTVGTTAGILVIGLVSLIYLMLVKMEEELVKAKEDAVREERKGIELQEHFIQGLHDSKERYKKLLEMIPIGVTVHANDKILFANRTFQKMLGLRDITEAMGQSVMHFIHPDFRRPFEEAIIYNNGDGTLMPMMEQKHLKKDGTSVDVEMLSYHCIYDGEPAIISLSLDISDRIRMENLRADTERIVRHDMRNPLNGIIGFSQLLKQDLKDEGQKELAGYIHSNGLTLLRMLNRSLDLFKMEEGTYKPEIKKFDLADLLTQIFRNFKNLLDTNRLSVKCNFFEGELDHNSSYHINGDDVYIGEMLGNLIRNALEASPKGGVINLNVSSDGQKYIFDIHNSGVIPASIRDSFFDRYTTYGKKGGTGIGTFSAKLIARALGGDIRFTTSDEEGTHLIVTLPVLEQA